MMTKHAPAAAFEDDGDPDDQTVARRGRPVGDRESKRNELLRAGIATIAELGYSGASLRKVASRAGHTTGAVTYYFQNKEAMVRAILEHLFDEWDTLLDIGGAVGDLRQRFRRWKEMNTDSDQWMAQFQLLAQARHEPALAEIYQRRYSAYRARLTATVAMQQRSGEVRDDIAADIIADQIAALADGWAMMFPIEPERFVGTRMDELTDAVLKMIEPPAKAVRR
ncbi:TetR/AcrR family transcriptional regulator [Sphingopyxis sp. KK2]|uniref:TetR/AcrR family transcriptional regulator n=1 Tax=Sphingopyxis sp. KK2 TaxID=1855727 RepID=UPI00097E6434|nr:TetR family transcriptional regulator C-terminal domain-containing protein [Sphingopyxis sp. KK2]